MASRLPEERVAIPIVRQRWRSVAFIHWPYEPAAVAPSVPPGLELDLLDGAAWVTAVFFVVQGARLPGLPPAPWLSTFGQANVRTYVRDGRGRDGLWFLSLDVARLPVVMAGRLASQLPYAWARIDAREELPSVRYAVRRLTEPSAGTTADVSLAVGRAVADRRVTRRDDFLTGRWRGFAPTVLGPVVVPVEHEPWPLLRATVHRFDGTLLSACGLGEPAAAALAHFSPGVSVKAGPPRPVAW